MRLESERQSHSVCCSCIESLRSSLIFGAVGGRVVRNRSAPAVWGPSWMVSMKIPMGDRLVSRCLVSGLLLASLLAGEAAAQSTYPVRPVRIVVPSPPAGGTDIIARVLAQHFSATTGQQFVV